MNSFLLDFALVSINVKSFSRVISYIHRKFVFEVHEQVTQLGNFIENRASCLPCDKTLSASDLITVNIVSICLKNAQELAVM